MNMSDKYWYEEGMCKAIGYKGQYPVVYNSNDGNLYTKASMGCDAVIGGKCKIADSVWCCKMHQSKWIIVGS